jgi:hypothetical protein
MTGGGVPRVMVLSARVDDPSDPRTVVAAQEVDDRTPIDVRWGGWYVTGSTGTTPHLGNLPVREDRGGAKLRALRDTRQNLTSLAGYFDTSTVLTDKSDVVALTVLEHQTWLQNQITRVDYKIRTVMERDGAAAGAAGRTTPIRSWADISPNDTGRLQQMMEPLVRALFLRDAVPFEDRMTGSSGFAARFQKLGPSDSRGRSLRELDLETRLFRYPLSFLIYSEQLDDLPPYALDYVHARIVEVLQGKDTTGIAASLSAADRKAVTEILIDTKPALAALLRAPQPAAIAR